MVRRGCTKDWAPEGTWTFYLPSDHANVRVALMKEMLFITVAILVPPTLTFLGVVGDNTAPRAELAWHAPTPVVTSAQPIADRPQLETSAWHQCWFEPTRQAQQEQTY